MQTISQDTLDTIERGDSLLVLSPTFSGTEPATCSDLLVNDGASEDHVLCITFTRSPDDHLFNWRRHGNVPDDATFIDVNASSGVNELDTEATQRSAKEGVNVTVEQGPSPENLTRLGVQVTNQLDGLTDGMKDREVTVCFDSVTALLQYVEEEQAFKFCHVLSDHLNDAGAKAHFHMDSGAHDQETIQTLIPIFDKAWAFKNGEWS